MAEPGFPDLAPHKTRMEIAHQVSQASQTHLKSDVSPFTLLPTTAFPGMVGLEDGGGVSQARTSFSPATDRMVSICQEVPSLEHYHLPSFQPSPHWPSHLHLSPSTLISPSVMASSHEPRLRRVSSQTCASKPQSICSFPPSCPSHLLPRAGTLPLT